MRKFLFTLMALGIFGFGKAQISTFPYTEDFESFSLCTGTCANACALSVGWTNPTVGDDIDWTTFEGPTTSGGTGPSVDHNPGTVIGNYLYIETSGSCSGGDIAHLVSPWFDFTGNEAKIEFWYHMFGGNMGTMHFDVDTSGGTAPWVLDVTPAWTDDLDQWQKASIVLCGLGNRDSVRFRIRGITGSTFESDMAVDDFTVSLLPTVDLEMVEFRSPSGAGCGLGNEIVEVCFKNSGTNSLPAGTNISMNYTLNGGTAINETLTLSTTLTTCDTLCYTFTALANLTTPASYTLDVWLGVTGDVNATNDTISNSIISIPTVATYPYFNDFESGAAGWTSSGTNDSWQFGAPTGGFITAANSGTNAYVTNLGGPYNNNELSFLESPCLDFSGFATDPFIQFAHIFQTESCCDETWVEVSTNGGTSWTKVGTAGSGVNWYNDATNQWWDGDSGTSGSWRTSRNQLLGTAGVANVRVRFVFSSDGSVTNDGVGVDDISIFSSLIDGTVTSLDSPMTQCGLSSAEIIQGTFLNNGTTVIDTAILCFAINGNTPVCETVTGLALAAGASYTHTFGTTGDFSAPGTTYSVALSITANGEQFASNDTVSFQVQHIPLIASIPYFEDFEANNGFWQGGGANSTWEWGIPNAAIINGTRGACGGTNAWVTNLTGLYNANELSFVISPCMDLGTITGPLNIRFDHIFDSETNFDSGWLESSTDNGATWAKVGVGGNGTNWYNNVSQNIWEGSSNGWRTAEYDISFLTGNSQVRLRFVLSSDGSVQQEGFGFDNIRIYSTLTDAVAGELTSPVSDCGLTATETVTGSFVNFGTDTLASMNVCFSINGGTPVCEVVTGPFLPGDTLVHTFAGTANLLAQGDYTVAIFPSVAGDSVNCADTTSTIVTNVFQVSTFPYVERFENGTGGWGPDGTNVTWTLGTPAKPTIVGAASGVNAWVNGGLTGDYLNGEDNWLQGPCFDFSTTTMTNPWVALNINYEIETSWDGANLEYSLDSGATWSLVGAFGAPFNWYNDNSIDAAPGGYSDGWSGDGGAGSNGWISAKHPLDTAILGQPYVLFRIFFASDGVVTSEGIAVDDIAIGEPPVVSLGNDTTVCGGHIVASGYATGTWEWSTGDTTSSITLVNAGTTVRTDTISVIYTDTFGLCGFDTVIVDVQPAPVFDLGADTTICFNGMITLDAGNSGGYNWSTGATTQTIMVATAGIYSVTVTDLVTSCSSVDSITVSQTTPVSLGPDATICAGDTVMAMANIAGGTYAWSTGATTQSIAITAGGAYSVTVTDGFGCVSSDTINVTLNPAPVASFNFTVSNDGLTYAFTDLSTNSPTSWAWDFGDTNTDNVQNPTHTYATDGSYTVTLIVTNACQSDTFTQSVMVVGLSSELAEGIVSIYPNPNQGNFEIAISDLHANDVSVSVMNVFGQQVWSQHIGATTGQTNEKMQLTGLSKGMYFVKIEADGKSLIKKVIVE